MKGQVQFNTLIPIELMEEIKQKGLRYRRIVELGVQHLDKRTNLDEELQELREGNKKLHKRISHMAQQLAQIQYEK